jgi:hypothetical protein
MDNIITKKTDETLRRWQTAIKDKNFDCIRNLPVCETRPEHFDRALADGKVTVNWSIWMGAVSACGTSSHTIDHLEPLSYTFEAGKINVSKLVSADFNIFARRFFISEQILEFFADEQFYGVGINEKLRVFIGRASSDNATDRQPLPSPSLRPLLSRRADGAQAVSEPASFFGDRAQHSFILH